MAAPRQLPLSLETRPLMDGEDFLVAESNAQAVAWLDRWPDWPGQMLLLHGAPGSGKTHLAEIWRQRSAADAAPEALLGDAAHALVEGLDTLTDEAALFHLINHVRQQGGTLLVTSRAAPATLGIVLPDLASRLRGASVVAIEPPDDALLGMLLVKQLADRQLVVGQEVVDYALTRMERSAEAARRLAAAIDRVSLAERRRITVPLVRRVLDELENG
jgi:chromosomal replication initiation ATPase DnaA